MTVPTAPTPDDPSGSDTPADEFLRRACLTYEDTGPAEWADAKALLARHPELVDGNVWAAAAVADVAVLGRVLDADPAAANRRGGPHGWEPLLYLAYARHDPVIAADAVLRAAQLLLDAGADPNAGFVQHDLPTPFTALTGAFGEGELGPERQPRHPHSQGLARKLLEGGADPNDGQALYNRMFGSDDDHLELLFEFGLGRGDSGPWRAQRGDASDSPADLVQGQLIWAVTHGMVERVRLLADHGADLAVPTRTGLARSLAGWTGDDGATPSAVAALTGRPEVVGVLVGLGAPAPDLPPDGAFVAAALRADRATVERLAADHPGVIDRVRDGHPGLVVWAAVSGGAPSVELLIELGFDVDGRGRTDIPSDQPWHTALHGAVEVDDLDLARTLLRLGADTTIRDQRFDGTPLDWAHHLGRARLVELLDGESDGQARS